MVLNLLVFYNFESELCFKVSLKFLNFVRLWYLLKKFLRDWISGCMKVNFKEKILKFSWYNGIKVLFLVGSMCKYFLNLY